MMNFHFSGASSLDSGPTAGGSETYVLTRQRKKNCGGKD